MPGGGPGEPAAVTAAPPGGDGGPAPSTSENLGVPTVVGSDPFLRWAVMVLGVGVVGLAVALFLRRRPAPPAPVPAATGAGVGPVPPGPDETTGNVTRLPTNLNAIYELGRLDERLAQERERRS
jgi:hypothetical protein